MNEEVLKYIEVIIENKSYKVIEKYKESIPIDKLKFLVRFYNRNYTYGANSESDIDDFQVLIGNQNQ
jgi:hypothetical protein